MTRVRTDAGQGAPYQGTGDSSPELALYPAVGSEAYAVGWTVKARVTHSCQGWHCHTLIKRGELYVRSVAFPGHDAVGGDRPWVMKLCRGCATEYGRPMPLTRAEQSARRMRVHPERKVT